MQRRTISGRDRPALDRTAGARRRHRRGGHERVRPRRPGAGCDGDRLRPRVVAVPRAGAGGGIAAVVGHDAANVPAGDGVEVCASTAVPADNPEVVAARARGRRLAAREDLLAELTALRRTIAVAGAHGKTTTSAMVAHVLLGAGGTRDTSSAGSVRSTGSNGAWGGGEWLVVEADESDRSMLRLRVDVAVVTNVELDHHATYADLEELEDCSGRSCERRRRRSSGGAPSCSPCGGKAPGEDYDHAVDEADAALSAHGVSGSRGAVWRSPCRCAGRHNARTPRRRSRPARWRGSPRPTPCGPSARSAGRRRFERWGGALGVARRRRLRAPPHRGGGDVEAARALGAGRAGRGCVPAAPLFAHAAA